MTKHSCAPVKKHIRLAVKMPSINHNQIVKELYAGLQSTGRPTIRLAIHNGNSTAANCQPS